MVFFGQTQFVDQCAGSTFPFEHTKNGNAAAENGFQCRGELRIQQFDSADLIEDQYLTAQIVFGKNSQIDLLSGLVRDDG